MTTPMSCSINRMRGRVIGPELEEKLVQSTGLPRIEASGQLVEAEQHRPVHMARAISSRR